MNGTLQQIVPVLPSADIERDIAWYEAQTGFQAFFKDPLYAGLRRDNLHLHLQWHADTEDDPLLGGSVIRVFVREIQPLFDEFVARGTVQPDAFRANTPWHTHEFGFYDLNRNAIFIVEAL